MKIAIGMNLQKGAFGGGNQFGKALSEFLTSKNIDVVFNLKERDIDIILLTETRKWLKSCAFDMTDVAKYLLKKPDTLIVFRVNECDERKSAKIKLLNRLIIEGVKLADKVVFISGWLKNLFISKSLSFIEKSLIIYNGADTTIFNSTGYKKWNREKTLRIVTHHWGGGWFKGFDVYLKLDELIGEKYKNKVCFTFIGNIPKNVKFQNTEIIPPKNGKNLADEIKKNHIYLTASINEPAGMHHIEGALCGLPLLYRNSGALPEYCNRYGISFNGVQDFEEKLEEMIERYDYFVEKVRGYNNTADKMCQGYYNLFLSLIHNKEDILKKRKLNRFSLYRYILFNTILKKMLWMKEKISSLLLKR